jgi:rSAM/selenodomain-associated transferase 1
MSCAIAVMAKAPVPGRCKTRLVPPLTHQEAAGMSAAFQRDITENLFLAARSADIVPYVAYAPAGAADLFEGVLAAGTRLVLADGSISAPDGVTGFGACLLHAVQTLLAAGHSSVCVVNSDSPTLPTGFLVQAARWLAEPGDRAVLGPADDGGYYLLGMKKPHANLFSDITWSTPRVAAETRGRALEQDIELRELPTWYDVDDAASLDRLCADLQSPGTACYPAPATAARLGLTRMDIAAE